jgi:gluconate 2-dehydrogenase gamma chain
MSISRRQLIKSLSVTAAAGSMLRVVPLAAAETAHRRVSAHKAAASSEEYTFKFFPKHQYKTLRALCALIIAPDQESGSAVEAGAPEFIDSLSSENKDLQRQLRSGIMWLDVTCVERYGQTCLQCAPGQRTEMLDLIAFRKNAEKDPRLSPGIEFFPTLRKYAADGFFTSEIGIRYLGYIGDTYLKEFPGCPAIAEV